MDAKIYLEANTALPEDPIDEAAVAAEIIALRQNGAPAGYKGFEEGDRLSDKHIRGIVQHGKNAAQTVKRLYKKVEQERRDLMAISPANFDLQKDFVDAIKARTEYIDDVMWFDKLRTYYKVSTWAELKEIFPTPPPPPPPPVSTEERGVDDIGIPTQASTLLQ